MIRPENTLPQVIVYDTRLDSITKKPCIVSLNVDNYATIMILKEWLEPYFRIVPMRTAGIDKYTILQIKIIHSKIFIRNYDSKLLFYLDKSSRVLFLKSSNNNTQDAFIILKIIRCLFKAIFLQHDYVNLHAGAFVLENDAILVTGDRNSGKTTFIINTISTGRFNFLANDQLVINLPKNKEFTVFGFPALITVRLDHKNPTNKIIEESALMSEKNSLGNLISTSVKVAPKTLTEHFGVKIVSKANPIIIIKYEKSSDPDFLDIKRYTNIPSQLWKTNLLFPLNKAVDKELFKLCKNLNLITNISTPFFLPGKIPFIQAVCGLDRMNSLLKQITSILKCE